GGPRHPDRTAAAFRETVARLGLPAIRLHDLRHTWATLALEAGVHPKVVQERLGHANVSITLDLYSHVAPAMATDAASKVAALILGT
ncbi:MAG: site-specific integrase, partial [Frankiaceae bacterium]